MKGFPTKINQIEERIRGIQPAAYSASRNYKSGAVTYLSPYISRGVISTRQVLLHIYSLNLPPSHTEKLIQELAWRDYWQQVWLHKKDEIFQDLKSSQSPVANLGIPKAVIEAKTGIEAVDQAIKELYETGYMHNHMRMYVAAICCNIAQSHWLQPARWMYSLLLDGDLGSNHLSWQWVAGTNSSKKYVANQANINKYFSSDQKGTFLDVPYADFERMEVPDILKEVKSLEVKTSLPHARSYTLKDAPTLIYNYYNLDPYWHGGEEFQRVLLLEPSFFEKFPVSQKCLDFFLDLSSNIADIQVFVGEFDELNSMVSSEHLIYKEHPTNSLYKGKEEPREWMSSVQGDYPSFFAFWKKSKKELLQ